MMMARQPLAPAPGRARPIRLPFAAPLPKRRRLLDPASAQPDQRQQQNQAPPPTGVTVAPLGPSHAAAATRLHRAARLAGVPVFGDGAGVAEAIAAACAGQYGAFGFVAIDEEEVAEGDDGVVGAVVVQEEEEEEGETKGGRTAAAAAPAVALLTVAVRADRRRQGVGGALVRALASRAAGQGASRVVADVARDNAPARALLEASGFVFGGGGGGGGAKSVEGVLELRS